MSEQLIRVVTAIEAPSCREAIADALGRGEGYDLQQADGLDQALKEVAALKADVLVLQLPHSDRQGLAPVALALAAPGGIPVIIISSPEFETLALRAVQQGCSDYLMMGNLYPLVVRRSIHYAVEQARNERRRLHAERALADSEQRYRSLFEQSRDAIYMTERSGEIVELNRAALDLLGYDADELIGQDVQRIYADPEDRVRFQRLIEAQGHVREFEVRLRTRDGKDRWCLVSSWIRRDRNEEVIGYQGIIHDITERKHVEDQLVHEAFHDTLTDLPNRALFMDRLERALARRRRGEPRDLAVLFLDMDRFKVVNDSMGHMAGDELLRRVARLLAEEIREEDTVARIGGDEFAILLDGVDDPADPTHVAERVQERLRAPFRLRGQDVFTSVSIGITFGGGSVEDPEELLRNADTAMYRAKELGPARYQIFDEAMHAHAVTLLQLETDLRLGLERDQFVVHYQPLVDVGSSGITGFEALVRWVHPERGMVHPASFIPIAEDTGLIIPLGKWVLRAAVRQLREWQREDPAFEELFVSVNLSAKQFGAIDLAETVARVLEEEGLPGPSLQLEITESAMMQSPANAIATLKRLRQLGVVLCIDDFGTGFSSLSTLHELPADILKIDRSFIGRLEDDDEGQMVEMILALARNLGMKAVAEGVETEGQLARLRDLGSASVQGFLFSTALEPDAARQLLTQLDPNTGP